MNSVLVTGCAGFIGFHLSNRLLELGFRVVGLDNLSPYYDEGLKAARPGDSSIKERLSFRQG